MKVIILKLLPLFSCAFISTCSVQPDLRIANSHFLFGQEPPGDVPKYFAPGIISQGFHEHSLTISPDGTEMFYVMADRGFKLQRIVHITQTEQGWSPPELASFSSGESDLSPMFSPDGNKLFFASKRRLTDQDEPGKLRLWVTEKVNDRWANPEPVEIQSAESSMLANPSIGRSGMLYFQYRSDNNNWDIYSAKPLNGRYQAPVKLGEQINTSHNESAPYIDPDERFLLFHSNRPGGIGSNDIYIAYRKGDSEWYQPINLGDKLNSQSSDWRPTLSPDGAYLFFSSFRSSEKETLMNKSFQELGRIYKSPENGYGTLYWANTNFLKELQPD